MATYQTSHVMSYTLKLHIRISSATLLILETGRTAHAAKSVHMRQSALHETKII